ncbi:FeoA domain [Arthrobacter agilis]|nr:FeoA domain [Arthrobacter agilis]
MTRSRRRTAASTIPPAHRLDQLDDGHAGRLVRVSDDDPEILRLLDRTGISLDDGVRVSRHGALLDLQVARGSDTPPLAVDPLLAVALWIEDTGVHPGCTMPAALR